ncbi:rhodanese-like domain-containing protein [Pseudonocardia bannensis]|uniref:Rhodanese-like domain-containing protein n=1 Tax=Pseudonocardia bannensis TaxID=630973 RepID=A0A848DSA1_9PSEU|nr:rhodanese-like domain-containing protein [Pseudonocardia bannensis]NMH95114.1 rhodanese-like domain-containing protein [Pseudonocardia bannensis]
MVPEIDLQRLATAGADGAVVIDVRNPDEYATGRVPGARLVPLPALAGRLSELPADGPVYVICQAGGRSTEATALLRRAGIDAYSVIGGTAAWTAAGRPVETDASEER